MHVVGPVVAADSESNLRTLRFVGASRAAMAMSRDMSLGLSAGWPNMVMQSPRALSDLSGDNAAPPGFRHRRSAPELA
jgi:hypothetical protein